MATLKEFEEALRQAGMTNALAILDTLKARDRQTRSIAPARRVVGKKMTADLAKQILELHARTAMTQQEIAFKLGVNQGRVNEVIKRGKWLNADPLAPELVARDKAMDRLAERAKDRRVPRKPEVRRVLAERRPAEVAPAERLKPSVVRAPPVERRAAPLVTKAAAVPQRIVSAQLAFLDL